MILYDIVLHQSAAESAISATRDSRQLLTFTGKRAIIVTSIRDPVESRRLRLSADFVIYEISQRTTEKELRRVLDNHLCDMILGTEQLWSKPGLHSQKILFNHVLADACARHGIVVLLDLRPLFSNEVLAPLVLKRLRFIAQVCQKVKVVALGISLAAGDMGRRNPKDLAALTHLLVDEPSLDLNQ